MSRVEKMPEVDVENKLGCQKAGQQDTDQDKYEALPAGGRPRRRAGHTFALSASAALDPAFPDPSFEGFAPL